MREPRGSSPHYPGGGRGGLEVIVVAVPASLEHVSVASPELRRVYQLQRDLAPGDQAIRLSLCWLQWPVLASTLSDRRPSAGSIASV